MSIPIRVSTLGQIEFWTKIAKSTLDNPDLHINFIKELIISKYQDRSIAEPFKFKGKK